jgi:hypothetical protein
VANDGFFLTSLAKYYSHPICSQREGYSQRGKVFERKLWIVVRFVFAEWYLMRDGGIT